MARSSSLKKLALGVLVAFLLLASGPSQPPSPATGTLHTVQGGGGFPNVPRTPGEILSGLNAPSQGRTAIIAYHNGLLFTVPEAPSSQPNSDLQVRTWDLSDPTAPTVTATWGITPMPINAHGYFQSGDYLILGSNWPPEAPWSFRATGTPGTVQRTTYPDLLCAGTRGCLFGPWYVGETWWSYGAVSGNASISYNWNELASWDHLGATGVIGHPFLIGDLLIFASDQSRTGVATYDVSDPTQPLLLDVLTTGGPGGYWPELWGGDGKLYLVFPYQNPTNGFRVVDLTDPTDLKFVTDRPLSGDEAMYAQFQDEFAFMGSHKVDLRTFESVLDLDGAHTVRPNDGGVGVNTSQFALPLGNLLVTGGVGEHQGMAIWAHQAAPDTRGPAVGFHIPQAGRTHYPTGAPITLLIHETLDTTSIVNGNTFIVRPLGGSPLDGRIHFSFNDILTFTPSQPLAPNTTYEVVLPAGGIRDAAGNGMVPYAFTFSTGGNVGGNAPPAITSFTAGPYPAAPSQLVSLAATGSDPNGDALTFRFDFGDGSAKTPWSASSATSHAYAEPGHYRATVQVRDPSGVTTSETTVVTVLSPPGLPRPVHSAPLALDAAARRLWVVNPDTGTLSAVHADNLTRDLEVTLCADPRGVTRIPSSGELWVACHDDDRLRVLDAAGNLLASLPTGHGSAPAAILAAPAGNVVYVSLAGSGALARFDVATRTETGRLPLGPNPRALAISGNGNRILVTRLLSPADHAEVWDVQASPFALTRTLRLPKFGGDAHRDSTASGRGTANYLTSIAIAPDGESAWVTANKPNRERGMLHGVDLDTDNSVRNLALEIDLVNNRLARAIDLDNSDSASALDFSPLGDYLLVTLQGNDGVLALDLLIDDAVGFGALVSRFDTGAAPQGVLVDGETGRTFVQNLLGRSVTAIETNGLFENGTVNATTTAISTIAQETLPASVLQGKRLFYHAGDPRMSAEGYLSCASCHLDGGSDARVWDFTGRGEGLRRTTVLRGRAGMDHGNVHWTANFDEIQDFEGDIRNAFGGAGFMDDADFAATSAPLGPAKTGLSADLDALAAYVASLGRESLGRSPFRNADGSMTAQGEAGRAHFAALGCANCHSGSRFTESTVGAGSLRDVGTLRTTSGHRLGGPLVGIDTPTLLGLWQTAPYFHDGSAASLEDVFRATGGQVVPGESGIPSNGAGVITQYVELNNDDTVRGRAYAEMGSPNARLTYTNLDGGAGGLGALDLRISTAGATSLQVWVNGASRNVAVPAVGNDPAWRHTNWVNVRVENVAWNAGPTNQVELVLPGGWPNVSVDEMTLSTAAELAKAQPHRSASSLGANERAALIAFLLQLDSTPETNLASPFFQDGFESGSTAAWSADFP